MPYRTPHGTHYHMTEGCCGAMDPCSGEGLEPCSICCGAKAAGQGGGGSPSGPSASSPAVAAPGDEAPGGDATGPHDDGWEGEALDAYDSAAAAAHGAMLADEGLDAALNGHGMPVNEYDVAPETYAALVDTPSAFGIESLPCPDRIPASWGVGEPSPPALPRWDAPMAAPGDYWFHELDAYSDDPVLSRQVAAAILPAMGRWPNVTQQMLRYGLEHGVMSAPASTRFHLNCPGGLACHSASVTARALEMMSLPENQPLRDELGPDWRAITATVAFWHDACKLDYYEPLEHPSPHDDGSMAFYRVARSYKDQRHGELSADIVRRFYGDLLPEVAYEAIDLHMGPWDHRCSPTRWEERELDEAQYRKRLADEAAKRADQDARVEAGAAWPYLRRAANARAELAGRIRGMSPMAAAAAIAASADPFAKEAGALLAAVTGKEGQPDDEEALPDAAAARAVAEGRIAEIIDRVASAPQGDPIAIRKAVLADQRAAADRDAEEKHEAALRAKRDADSFSDRMQAIWDARPFVRLIHEADAWSADAGR